MEGWKLASPPEGFGWAPGRHLRATLERGTGQARVIVRQSWSTEGFDTETLLYTTVLPRLSIKTATLWVTFSLASDGSQWMVLEDLGERKPEGGSLTDGKALFTALGRLHGEGLALANGLSGNPLPLFAGDSLLQEWMPLLTSACADPHFELPEYTPAFLDALCLKLTQQPLTLLHGDTDPSNVIIIDGQAALIDWERAKLGPPSLDLGKALEAVQSQDALTSYRSAFNCASGCEISDEQVQEWADLAAIHNSLHWICYYVRHARQESGPDLEWRRDYYEPCVRRLREIAGHWLA